MVKLWTLEQWEQVSQESANLPENSIIPLFLDDYVRYETESLRCRKKKT